MYNTSKYCYTITKFSKFLFLECRLDDYQTLYARRPTASIWYKNEDGTVDIDKINSGGEGTTEVWPGTGSSNIVTRNAQMLFP